jgi:hypothetical protein
MRDPTLPGPARRRSGADGRGINGGADQLVLVRVQVPPGGGWTSVIVLPEHV